MAAFRDEYSVLLPPPPLLVVYRARRYIYIYIYVQTRALESTRVYIYRRTILQRGSLRARSANLYESKKRSAFTLDSLRE